MEIFGIATIEHVFWTICGGLLAFTMLVLMIFLSVAVIGGCIFGLYCGAKEARDFIRREMEGWDW